MLSKSIKFEIEGQSLICN